ncbi:hypothetical protein [Candidatus Methylacidiphilum infernorum]|uniref:hypothetical protein n=1 Tax=Candidatus Methylacidiphilum infernorum TaxID=511746 RepID=UPI0011D07596|nr:hypothetical protein [Candidatus Methylacidiphilum infernorum]
MPKNYIRIEDLLLQGNSSVLFGKIGEEKRSGCHERKKASIFKLDDLQLISYFCKFALSFLHLIQWIFSFPTLWITSSDWDRSS